MSVPVCDWCEGWIETSNRTHPGYCSPGCHQAAVAERNAYAQLRAQHVADVRRSREVAIRERQHRKGA